MADHKRAPVCLCGQTCQKKPEGRHARRRDTGEGRMILALSVIVAGLGVCLLLFAGIEPCWRKPPRYGRGKDDTTTP